MQTNVSDNPLRDGTRIEKTAPPCAVVIFGATGDLTRRKLVPALYSLAQQRLLPAEFAILGTARQEMNDEEFRARMREALEEFEDEAVDETVWQSFASGLFYVQGEFGEAETYQRLKG